MKKSAVTLDEIFAPRGVAVVGASERAGSVGRAVMQNLIDAGFEGPIHPVNTRQGVIMGRKAVPHVRQIDAAVDLVVVATPMETVPGVIAECARMDAAGAVVLSAGGKETGAEGRRWETRMQEAAAGTGPHQRAGHQARHRKIQRTDPPGLRHHPHHRGSTAPGRNHRVDQGRADPRK